MALFCGIDGRIVDDLTDGDIAFTAGFNDRHEVTPVKSRN